MPNSDSLTISDRVWWKFRKYAIAYTGWDGRNWLRVTQIKAFEAFLVADDRSKHSVLEISPGWNSYWKSQCDDYTAVDFPEFDICKDRLDRQFNTVIADQVFEHVQRPIEAAKNLFSMVEQGGWAMIATPFLFKVHARPHDYSRWTQAGLRQLLLDGGFEDNRISTFAWGNKSVVRAHVGSKRVLDYGWKRDLSNDDEYPIMVWAFAQR